jgi:hypothetical protein
VTWLLARHPQQWAKLLLEIGREPRSAEEIAAIFAKVLGQPIGETEAEWREWARRGSRLGTVSHLPQ